jgi:hypothetical protein
MQRLKKGTRNAIFLAKKKLKKRHQPRVQEPKKRPIL